jgi:hypothetical protein
MKEEEKLKWNTTVKLQERQKEQIDKFLKDIYLNYRSVSDFVIKAVEKEIKEATLKSELSPAGKIIFEDISNHKRYEAFVEALPMLKHRVKHRVSLEAFYEK